MIIAKVVGIFAIVFMGYGAVKIGWLSASASKPLSVIVINITLPCMTVVTMAEAEFSREKLTAVAAMFLITIFGCAASWGIGLLFNKLTRVPVQERGIFVNAMMFTNNGFMGYPVALAVFGSEGLFLMLIIGCATAIFVYTFGIANVKKDAAVIAGVSSPKRSIGSNIRGVFNAPIIGVIFGFVIYFLRIPMPGPLVDVLSSVGSMMTPLSMLVIGLQLTESSPKEILTNRPTILITIMRLIVLPALFFFIMYLFRMPVLWLAIGTLNYLMPVAAALAPIATQNGANAKRSAEIIFLSTVFSMITVPVASVLLHML